MKNGKFVLRLLMVLTVFLVANIIFAFIAFHITSWIYSWLGKHPYGFWQQFNTVIAVFVLFACSAAIIFFTRFKKNNVTIGTPLSMRLGALLKAILVFN